MASAKKKTVSVSFKGVEGRRAVAEEGEHLATVSEVTLERGPKAAYLKWEFDLDDDAGKAWTNTSLQKNALFNLRGLLEALGVEIDEADAMDLDLTEFPDMRVGLVIEHETYEGKKQARIVDYYPEDEAQEKDEKKGGKKDKKKDKKANKKKKKDKDKLAKSDVEDMDRDGLLELNTEHELELDEDKFKDNKGGLKKLLAAVLEKLHANDLLEESDEAGDKVERSKVEDSDSDELQALIDEHELEVDLDDHGTLKKQVKAVLKALEEKDLLED